MCARNRGGNARTAPKPNERYRPFTWNWYNPLPRVIRQGGRLRTSEYRRDKSVPLTGVPVTKRLPLQ